MNIPELEGDRLDIPLDYASRNPEKQPRPYVAPYLKPVMREGQLVDELWVKVTAIGGKDTLDKRAEEWVKSLIDHAHAGRIPATWPKEFRDALEQWREGEELPTKGTPIKTWPALSPSQRDAVLNAKIRTVEELAGANDEAKGRIGMGCENLVLMAKRWVEEAAGPGAMASQIASLAGDKARLELEVERLSAKVEELEALLPSEMKAEGIKTFAPGQPVIQE